MNQEIISISESTPGEPEISPPKKEHNNIISITNKVVNGDLIDLFDVIPDAMEQPRLPFAITVQLGERHSCLAGGHLVNRGVPVQCIVLETVDISKTSLALLKVSLWMTGLLVGTLSYAEQARYVRILYNLHIEDAGIIVNSNGGDRRSEAFKAQEGEHIRQYIARSLDRSVFTIKIYLDHTRYLNLEKMNELVLKRVLKSSFVRACKLRTEFISGLPENLTEEEITTEVSGHFFEWVSIYDSTKGEIIPKVDEQNTETGGDSTHGEGSETRKDSAAATPNPITESESGTTHQESNPAPKGNQTGVPDKSPTSWEHQPASGENKPASETVKAKESTPDPEKDAELKEEENDIATGIPLRQNISLVNTQEEANVDIYQRIGEIANKLASISQVKPARELLGKPIGECISSLLKIVRLSNVQRSSSSVTLARKKAEAA